MFEPFEMGREFLTARNALVVHCIICLNNIPEEDQFMSAAVIFFILLFENKDYKLSKVDYYLLVGGCHLDGLGQLSEGFEIFKDILVD